MTFLRTTQRSGNIMSNSLRLGAASESEDLFTFSTTSETAKTDFSETFPSQRPSAPSSSGYSSYSALRQPEQIGVVISGFGIDTRATPIYAGRRPSRLL
ncbi:MAG: hypothetical protein WCT03_15000 [Candidatus Obscuribacterales bacterium]